MRFTFAAVILAGCPIVASAQLVLSAHSGLIQYVQGDVFLGNKPVQMKFGQFPEIKANQELRTEEGRAEVLLTPGAFLRLAENSAVRLTSNHLSDTRFELLKGEIVVEIVDSSKDAAAAEAKGNSITVLLKGAETTPRKAGLYRFDADPARVRVYDGEAVVKSGASEVTLKRGHETALGETLTAAKFDSKTGDELIRWSGRRSGYLAAANVSAAQSISSTNGFASGFNSGWVFNPWYGMYTYVPLNGIGYSPYGYGYWSPYTVGNYLAPLYYTTGPSYRGGNVTSSGGFRPVTSVHAGHPGGQVYTPGRGTAGSAVRAGGARGTFVGGGVTARGARAGGVPAGTVFRGGGATANHAASSGHR